MSKMFAVLALVFIATFSFAGEAPSLWSPYYGPQIQSLTTNIDEHGARFEERLVLNQQVLNNTEFVVPIRGIGYKFSKVEDTTSKFGRSITGKVGNSPYLSIITTDGENTISTLFVDNGDGRSVMYNLRPHEGDHALYEVRPELSQFRDEVIGGIDEQEFLRIESLQRRRAVRSSCDERWEKGVVLSYDSDVFTHTSFSEGKDEEIKLLMLHNFNVSQSTFINSKVPIVLKLWAIEKDDSLYGLLLNSDTVTALEHSARAKYWRENGNPLLSHYKYKSDPARPYGGLARLMGNYSLVTLESSGQIQSHEIAHNFGAHHQPEVVGVVGGDYQYARAHHTEVFMTVTAYGGTWQGIYLCALCHWIPVFSSPDLTYQGVPTGRADERDNARVLLIGAEKIGAEQKCRDMSAGKLLMQKSVESN
jgi:hypothetical protein